ncbi:glycine betaine ABC transporter substrate-binding protein [Anaerovorax sp. IOR16]|uniref:glycine betaine ABC transporter substrate-binding protein n=1 Tax=Anaerovorax sp. IOR16 TaxID=2773458 RepID=UPI0019D14C31|nr:glycine betaine ABC transporter substrate-binding protein [Anaerovorax sp. IOR16]
MKTKKMKVVALALALVLMMGVLATGCSSGSKEENTLTIGGKKFTEQVILVNILEQLIENRTDIDVINQADLGATDVLQQGMLDKDLDMYVEYTGTAYMIVLKEELDTTDPQIIYDRVKDYYQKEFDMTWMTPFGFNNTYCIAVKSEDATKYGLEKISDLKGHSEEMILGSDFDFLEREDGADYFNKAYGLTWKDLRGMDPGLMYSAVKENQIEAIVAYATDGRIPRYELKVLEDDLAFFPPYFASAVINNDALEKFPEVSDLMEELAPHLTMEKMQELNSLVDIDGMPEGTVAKDFLTESGLI